MSETKAWVRITAVENIPLREGRSVEFGCHDLAIFNLGNRFLAVENRCPHRGGSLCHGVTTSVVESTEPGEYRTSRPGEIIRCPWHSWEFDIRTGKSWCDPNRVKARQYPVSVEPGAALVEGPYVAETFPVSVENAYVVVEA